MKFWIVTPSYNQLEWLKNCVASVADQAGDGIEVHHYIQDAQSSDGTEAWLADYQSGTPSTEQYQLTFASEADEGMYDAINTGWKRSPEDVDVIAHLNCDEQYLPDALKTIAAFLSSHPRADVVLADMVVVDDVGDYICHRRSLRPFRFTSKYCVGGFTATTFQRASVTKDKQVFFNTSWKNFGDKVWYNELHAAGCSFSVLNALVSVFTDTGENLNWTDEGLREKKRYEDEFLIGRSIGTKIVARTLGLRRALKELLLKAPKSYSIFLKGNDVERVELPIRNPTGLWHKRWKI